MVEQQLHGRDDLGVFAAAVSSRILRVKDAMRESWFRAHKYGLSSEVQSVENELLYRLSHETASLIIQRFLLNKQCLEKLRTRDEIKDAWALAVGKKMLSERLISRGRASIIEHTRATQWAEAAYKTLRCTLHQCSSKMI